MYQGGCVWFHLCFHWCIETSSSVAFSHPGDDWGLGVTVWAWWCWLRWLMQYIKAFCWLFQAAKVVLPEQCWLFLWAPDTSSVTPVLLYLLITSFQTLCFGAILPFYVKSLIACCVHPSKDRWHLDNSLLWPVFSSWVMAPQKTRSHR